MGSKSGKPRQSKRRSDEFKREAVRRFLSRGSSTVADVAEELKVSISQLYRWRDEYGESLGLTPRTESGELPTEHQEIEELRKKVRELEKDNEFLKKAAAFFAKETS